jgi:hypothetical protein
VDRGNGMQVPLPRIPSSPIMIAPFVRGSQLSDMQIGIESRSGSTGLFHHSAHATQHS